MITDLEFGFNVRQSGPTSVRRLRLNMTLPLGIFDVNKMEHNADDGDCRSHAMSDPVDVIYGTKKGNRLHDISCVRQIRAVSVNLNENDRKTMQPF